MNKKQQAVAIWLILGVVMIIIQTLLGGVTRLTGSGLSITEWKPIMGALPPLGDAQWSEAFEKYKQIGQYKIVNSNFSLSDFKSIFFWEWFHRLWARMLGVVFAVGFIFFLIRGYFDKKMIRPFIILFILGGLQGLVGWLMVKTGLNTEDVHVHYVALSIHFIAAMILACYTLWFALQLLIPQAERIHNSAIMRFTIILIAITFIQLMYGSFMAGLKAAAVAPTWPMINGFWVPPTVMTHSLMYDADQGALMLNIHFMHRTIAYVLVILICWWFVFAKRRVKNSGSDQPTASRSILFPPVLVCVQLVLGITAVLCSPWLGRGKIGTFEIIAETHQLVAMFLLMALIVNLYVFSSKRQ